MSNRQNMVLWLGLGLILARLFTTGQWNALWGTVKSGSTLTGLTTPNAPASAPATTPVGGVPGKNQAPPKITVPKKSNTGPVIV